MDLYIYNTLNRKKEKFTPIEKNNVRMYVCGPTVYDDIHVGNARPLIVFDLLYRILLRLFPTVTYIRNITDIDDKINERAIEKKISIGELCDKTIKNFHSITSELDLLKPSQEPRATQHIGEMIDIIKILIEKKIAYEKENHIFFSINKIQDYGKLSKKNKEDMFAGARVEIFGSKENPGDFVLWKPSSDIQPGWNSPWGRGRPGWHIECSAMSHKYLGKTFDIHGGGLDLIFPHHENEIAQSCSANDTNFMAKYWMHNGYVIVEGKKMSKSLGNFITVINALKKYNPEVIRYHLLSTHYRSPLDFNTNSLNKSKNILDSFYRTIYNLNLSNLVDEIDNEFFDALLDDLNTPKALSFLSNLSNKANKGCLVSANQLKICANFLGLLKQKNWFNSDTKSKDILKELVKERNLARKDKNFKRADQIRKKIEQMGYKIRDEIDETKLEKI